MSLGRAHVRQGKTYAALLGAILLGSACSIDSSVSFDPDPELSGNSGRGGASGAGNGSGGSTNGSGSGSKGGIGSGQGGSASGGRPGGSDAGGSDAGGSDSEGGEGGSGNGGANNSGGGPTSGSGGTAGGSSTAGSDGSGGSGGGGGIGGVAGSGGSRSGEGGSGGSGDGAPCTTGVFDGHSYAFCGAVASAEDAFAKCESLGMGVVSIESKAENTFVEGKQGSTWLGGTDEAMEGEWRWVATKVLFWNEKPVGGAYQNFTDGQPNNKDKDGNAENCLVLTASGWNDVGCALGDFKATCESLSTSGPPGPPGPPDDH
jgi:Lectin C-type domain